MCYRKRKYPDEFYIDPKDKDKWQYLKGPKTIKRKSPQGFTYNYSEGGMIFPDALDNASRTIVTGEGRKISFTFQTCHKYREGIAKVDPLELERLNTFPENHTKVEGITDAKRAFFMGNALVVEIVERLGEHLYQMENQPQYA